MHEKRIEAEIRSFLTPERFAVLLERLKAEAEHLGKDEQETWYFDCPQDLRIQRNSKGAKIWLKKGRLHDEAREEIEIPCARENFSALPRLFEALGYGVEIKWFRTRHTFRWKGVSVMLDHTRGFGHVIELEKMCDPEERGSALNELKRLLSELYVEPTPKHVFQEQFAYYRDNWEELTGMTEEEYSHKVEYES